MVLLTVGRLAATERYKGQDHVIAALSQLQAIESRDLIYLIAGEGDDRARLESLVAQHGVLDKVRFLGAIDNQALPDLYRAADLFVMPSTGEGFGISFVESMACGTPAFGLRDGGARDARQRETLRLAEQAAAEVDSTREQVAQQVRAAWLGLSVGAERVQALAEGLHASVARRDATQLGREVGQRTTLDLLNAENDAASAQLAMAQGRVDLLMDRLRLAALTGQLDEATLRSVNGELAASPP